MIVTTSSKAIQYYKSATGNRCTCDHPRPNTYGPVRWKVVPAQYLKEGTLAGTVVPDHPNTSHRQLFEASLFSSSLRSTRQLPSTRHDASWAEGSMPVS